MDVASIIISIGKYCFVLYTQIEIGSCIAVCSAMCGVLCAVCNTAVPIP